MDVVGSEIGQKMRSAIKAKLTELGCYVDDELPDYVMVMVANKRTRAQMEDDLQLFLGDNTEQFVSWLHQVLKKLQEVTVAAPKPAEPEKDQSHSKERKTKEKKSKDKTKKSDLKKAKKKEKAKEKILRKKEQKKAQKKKKIKDEEIIRPNIPPLLMNMEKDSEPSITDVFAGQILKNHGILVESVKEDPKDTKPEVKTTPEAKRPVKLIIDPSTIISTPTEGTETSKERRPSVSSAAPKEDQLKEITEIEAKIQGLRQKLAEQLDSMSEDEDFLNIRTEAEELMNDFAEDVFQEISEQTPAVATPPVATPPPPTKAPTPPLKSLTRLENSKDNVETLPHIELNLPKRPIRERLGARDEQKKPPHGNRKEDRKAPKSPESFTPEREIELSRTSSKSARSRIGPVEPKRKSESTSENYSSKRLTSRVSVLDKRSSGRSPCASVVRIRARTRGAAPASSLLLRAVADAHKSLLNIPPKVKIEAATMKRVLLLPIRKVDTQGLYVPVGDDNDAISLGEPESDDDRSSKETSDAEKDEYVPTLVAKRNPNEYGPSPLSKKMADEYAPGLIMKIENTEYVASRRFEGRTASRRDRNIVTETINIHNPTVGKDKNTQFIVTMDGFNPNAFLAKKLQTEGILNDDDKDEVKTDESKKQEDATKPTEKEIPKTAEAHVSKERTEQNRRLSETSEKSKESQKSSLSETSEISDANNVTLSDSVVVVKEEKIEKRKSESLSANEESLPIKKRKSSPIVFDVDMKETDKDRMRQRTESVGSDNHVTVTTTGNSHKYDTLPPLSIATPADKNNLWCRSFPNCRYGSSCAFQHPRCKFAAACTRRSCVYSHSLVAPPLSPAPVVASHVVPAANYKSISAAPLPAMCKYYPTCANPACHFYHPKPCRYGKMCAKKIECNFYHPDVPTPPWHYSFS